MVRSNWHRVFSRPAFVLSVIVLKEMLGGVADYVV